MSHEILDSSRDTSRKVRSPCTRADRHRSRVVGRLRLGESQQENSNAYATISSRPGPSARQSTFPPADAKTPRYAANRGNGNRLAPLASPPQAMPYCKYPSESALHDT